MLLRCAVPCSCSCFWRDNYIVPGDILEDAFSIARSSARISSLYSVLYLVHVPDKFEVWNLYCSRKHTGAKPFHCKGCGKNFVFLVSVRKHVRSFHDKVGLCIVYFSWLPLAIFNPLCITPIFTFNAIYQSLSIWYLYLSLTLYLSVSLSIWRFLCKYVTNLSQSLWPFIRLPCLFLNENYIPLRQGLLPDRVRCQQGHQSPHASGSKPRIIDWSLTLIV